MKHQLNFLLAGLLTFQVLQAQDNEIKDIYQTYNARNFRTNKMLHKKVSLEHVDYDLLNAAVFFCTNEQRLKYKKHELNYVSALENAAFIHSKQMGDLSFFSHVNNMDQKLKGPTERGKQCGITNPFLAENIVSFYSSDIAQFSYIEIAEKLMSLWKSSKPHWKNILSGDALQLGCGVYYVSEESGGTFYGTQNFQYFEPVMSK